MDKPARDGQHDFDFEFGTWATHLRRLKAPLTGSSDWVEYEGTSVVRPIWGGRANLVELDVAGPAGRIEGLNLRLYRPQAGQWSLTFASSANGLLATPAIGAFEDGLGDVLFAGGPRRPGDPGALRHLGHHRDELSLRAGVLGRLGTTWEPNWIAIDTRIRRLRRRRGDGSCEDQDSVRSTPSAGRSVDRQGHRPGPAGSPRCLKAQRPADAEDLGEGSGSAGSAPDSSR